MNIWKTTSLSFCASLVWIFLFASGHGQATSRLSTTFIARGEKALLEVAVAGGRADEVPEISSVKNVTIRPSGGGPRTRMLPGRKLESSYEYLVEGYETGRYVIPPIEVSVGGTKNFTEPLEFVIFDPDELQWSTVASGAGTIRYATTFRTLVKEPFENQTVPTEIKVFVPEQMVIEDWGIPDFERNGVAAWRFQPSAMRSRINLLGLPYVSVAYPSTITPTRNGQVSIGPARVRLTTREVIMDPFPRTVNPEVYVQVPKLEFTAKPLPEGAPAGFENAVGSFKISATAAVTEIQEGDPISVDITVTGSGNLDILRPPQLENAAGWKVYGTTNDERGDERRELSGSVIFHQSLRPLEMMTEIPPFRLVYFDPKDESYKTVTTEPIRLQMTRSAAAAPPMAAEVVQAAAVPFERMTDILAILPAAQLTRSAEAAFPWWIVHGVGAVLAYLLVAKAFWLRFSHRFQKNPARKARLMQLREMEKSNDAEFLKSAGGFVEQWLAKDATPEMLAILAERDDTCFRVEKSSIRLAPSRRSEILKLLRKAAVLCIFLAAFAPLARAEDAATQANAAYESAKYDEAIAAWLSAGKYETLSGSALYNIGNACYRSNSPGYAALFYRRALARDTEHSESRQNLRFLERKYGSITVERADFQRALMRFPLAAWKAVFWSGAWICVLALLVIPATRRGASVRLAAGAAFVCGALFLCIGVVGWRGYPNDAQFSPLAKQAVIILEKVSLHTDAARTSPEVIDAPPGSLCEILAESGRWVYVAFANKTRGWVPVEAIEKVIPDTPPTVPKFQKPKEDGKSA